MSDLCIRPMIVSDLPAVDVIQRKSFVPELIEPMSLFEKMLSHYDHASYVAELDNHIVGYLMAHPSTDDSDDYEEGFWPLTGNEEALYIHDMCVDPSCRGKGVAKSLFERLVVFASENNFQKLVGIAVQDADSFWQNLGFTMLYSYPYKGEEGMFMIKELV